MALLRFDGLSFAYPYDTRRTLQNVSFEMAEGEYLVLCGPSGCGKTTLLKQAKRELRPAGSREGQVLYQNTPVDMLDAEMAFTEIGYVQQNPEDQIVTDFVWHELAFGLENLALPTKVIRRRVAEMAAFFGMEPWFRKKTSELSGGQKQMLNLASVMAMNPKLLILDEPTSMLDPLAARSLLDTVERINRELGVAVLLTVFCIVKAIFAPVLLNKAASMAGIAVAHSVFNILCTAILLPCGDLLEKLAIRLVPDKAHAADKTVELDQRLLTTPAVALERCRVVTCEMAEVAVRALQNALRSFDHYTEALASSIREDESRCDHYEDVLGTYLVKLSAQKLGEQESEESAELLKAIGDFERISDHAVNVLESAEELREKGLAFSDEAKRELSVLSAAVNDILMRALDAFREQDMTAARQVEPLEQVIDDLKEQLRTRHILRMQQGQCSIEAGFVWSDLLTDLERTSDHCSNIAGCVIDAAHHDLNMHATLDAARRRDPDFREQYQRCAAKYQV